MIKKLLILAATILSVWGKIQAQSAEIPLGSEEYNIIDRLEIRSGMVFQNIHTSEKPYRADEVVKITYLLDSLKTLFFSRADRYDEYYLRMGHDEYNRDGQFESKLPILKTFYKNKADFFKYVSNDFEVRINPIFDLLAGDVHPSDNTGTKFYNTRGADMSGYIMKKLGFWGNVTENQFRPPVYYQNWVNQYGAVPGYAYYKNFKQTGFDFLDSRGGINFKALKVITITAAHDKNFIGDGYRSLILSDNAAPYNFLKIQTNVWRFQYELLYAELISDYNRGADTFLTRKFFVLHHLSMNLGKHVNVGFMENIMSAQPNVVKVGYLNPLVLYRSAEYYYGSPDKVTLGANIKINMARCIQLYGQWIINDMNVKEYFVTGNGWWGNKEGYQAGVKYIDALGIRNLDLQLEFNQIDPYTYSNSNTIGDYTQYNQPLADPWGANLREGVAILRYKAFHRFYITPQFSFIATGLNENGKNYGQDIFEPYTTRVMDYNVKVLQGLYTTIRNAQLMLSYEVKYNMFFDVQFLYRSLRNVDTTPAAGNTQFVMAGFRMYIARPRFDF